MGKAIVPLDLLQRTNASGSIDWAFSTFPPRAYAALQQVSAEPRFYRPQNTLRRNVIM
jgi:hypothetical protein